jgi:hypothetical protein
LDGFAQMARQDGCRGVKIGDGARDFEDAVWARAERPSFWMAVSRSFSPSVEISQCLRSSFGRDLGVGVDFLLVLETRELNVTPGDDAVAHGGEGLGRIDQVGGLREGVDGEDANGFDDGGFFGVGLRDDDVLDSLFAGGDGGGESTGDGAHVAVEGEFAEKNMSA